jgi:methionyl-tRNA formyltransferase
VTDRPVRTIFLGSGGFGRESLHRLAADDAIELVGVVTAPVRPAGRGRQLTRTVIETAARELGIERVLTPARLRSPESVAEIVALRPELLVLADYGQIVPAVLLAMPHGALNLHPSLLPRHRGATPIPAAILAGDAETGVSLMRMDAGLDTGPIIAQVTEPLDGRETTPALETRLESLAADLLERSLGPWLAGELEAVPQPAEGASLTRPLRREDGRLDPAKDAITLERQVRAYQPWPGSFVDVPLGRLVIWVADAEVDVEDGPPQGTFDERGLAVGEGQRLRLVEVQPAGGGRMSWEAFVNGRPGIVGGAIRPPS